ncbi:hypothetical protein EYF80_024560 [Liparis tanakae]|uniref:Uncharacterized protein n=1 Tax=Liparis tanakae TaxID=230148 RepID=A0A4Z2HI51_9TELE|nr:hypothetical protein EYF80_024560 [Liparis tanakae]
MIDGRPPPPPPSQKDISSAPPLITVNLRDRRAHSDTNKPPQAFPSAAGNTIDATHPGPDQI